MRYFYDDNGNVVGSSNSSIVLINGLNYVDTHDEFEKRNVSPHHLRFIDGDIIEISEDEKQQRADKNSNALDNIKRERELEYVRQKKRQDKIDRLLDKYLPDSH